MTVSPDLEERLRAGLRRAAEAVPPAPDTVPTPREQVVLVRPSASRAPQRPRAVAALAAAAALAAVVGSAVVLASDDRTGGEPGDVAASSPDLGASRPHEVRTVNGMVPGQATGDPDGTALRLYGPDGQPTGTVDLGPMTKLRSAASDLEGGWVVCGAVDAPPERSEGSPDTGDEALTSTGPAGTDDDQRQVDVIDTVDSPWQDRLTWFPAGGTPVDLRIDGSSPNCSLGGLQVVDSADGPLALVGDLSLDGQETGVRLDGIVLETGERRELPVPDLPGVPYEWSATTGLALSYIEGVGLQLFDLDSAEQLPTAAIDPGDVREVALAHDGKTAAVLVSDNVGGPVEALVYDLATGAELFRRSIAMSADGEELSYDGTTLAVGNYDDRNEPVTVIDLATGTEHTIAGGGVVL